MSYVLVQGTASSLPLADESVQTCVTSPPYWGLRSYAGEQREWWGEWYGALGLEPTPELYVEHLVTVFREVRRVLRKDGVLFLNLGDSYAAAQGLNKDGSARLPKRATTIHHAERAWADGGRTLPSQAMRVTRDNALGIKPKDLVGIPWMVAFALRADGWYLRSDIIWAKPNPMPESVTDRPTKAHEYLFLLAKSQRYYYDADAIREAHAEATAERYAAGFKDRYADATDAGGYRGPAGGKDGYTLNERGRNRRSVWTIATQPYAGAHFATFPEALVEPCILAGSKAGDVVLDPFVGSGTTLRVAIRHGRSGIGIDISGDYLREQARNRADKIQTAMGL